MTEHPIQSRELFDLSQSLAGPLLEAVAYPWEALTRIGALILQLGPGLPQDQYQLWAEGVWVSHSCQIDPSARIEGPAIIGHRCQVRPGAYIRTNALIGDDVVVGHVTEIKNVILFNGVQVPHYNYVGDSILGHLAHLGAGAITSNVRSDQQPVVVSLGERRFETGLKKMGALLGDQVEIGCNSVLNPGSIVGRQSQVYPLTMVRGFVPAWSIVKQSGQIVARRS